MPHLSERNIIEAIARQSRGASPDLIKGIGDDCAVVRKADGLVELWTTDALVQGVHFDLSWHPPQLLGRKAASVNISDIGAMGGRPRFALLCLLLLGGIGLQVANPQIMRYFIDAAAVGRELREGALRGISGPGIYPPPWAAFV